MRLSASLGALVCLAAALAVAAPSVAAKTHISAAAATAAAAEPAAAGAAGGPRHRQHIVGVSSVRLGPFKPRINRPKQQKPSPAPLAPTAAAAAAPEPAAATAAAAAVTTTRTETKTATAAAPAGETGTSLLSVGASYGWEDDELKKKRNYVCKYSKDGGPCRGRSSEHYPSDLQCPPSYCCSKTHIFNGQSGEWCTSSWALCNGILNYGDYSYGQCTCDKHRHKCPDAAECRQDDAPLGGAYCQCKEGFIGDGRSCVEDKCRTEPCHPGQCALVKGEAQCSCPENYEVDNTKKPQGCKVTDTCKLSPCGDTKAAKACYHEGPGRYSCDCNLGYIAVEVNNKLRCDDIFNHFVCSTSPCGVEGVKECLDTPRGVRCTCLSGYTLVKETARYRCVREDPCLSNPCGMPDIVSSCVATSASYVCTCKEGYKVAVEEKGPYCAVAEQQTSYVFYAGIGGGALLLLFAVFAFNYMRKGPELDEEEMRFLQENGGDGVSGTAYFDPSAGWS